MSKNATLDKAFDHFYNKKYKEAVKLFNKALTDKKTPDRLKQRLQQYKRIAEIQAEGDPKPEKPSLKLVSYLMNVGEYGEAEKALEKADSIIDSVKAFLRAEIKIAQNELKQGAELLKEAIKLDPANTGYALNSPTFSSHLKSDELTFLRDKVDRAQS